MFTVIVWVNLDEWLVMEGYGLDDVVGKSGVM